MGFPALAHGRDDKIKSPLVGATTGAGLFVGHAAQAGIWPCRLTDSLKRGQSAVWSILHIRRWALNRVAWMRGQMCFARLRASTPLETVKTLKNMTVNFPNLSRSYDATRRVVRFWGYDRSMENSFYVTADALTQLQPDMQSDEAGFLRAFDINRALIYAIAAKVYARGRKGSYDLTVADF
jgi:hypothetical protein